MTRDAETDRDHRERDYTSSISEEDRQHSFDLEDRRWARKYQIRDWILLVVAIIIWIAFQLSFYFLVPGLR